jgi:hypothetical protein
MLATAYDSPPVDRNPGKSAGVEIIVLPGSNGSFERFVFKRGIK